MEAPYVPKLALEELTHADPATAFQLFCQRFAIDPLDVTSHGLLRYVVLFLLELDHIVLDRSLSPEPIYEALKQRELNHAEELLDWLDRASAMVRAHREGDVLLGKHRQLLASAMEYLHSNWQAHGIRIVADYRVHLRLEDAGTDIRVLIEKIEDVSDFIELRQTLLEPRWIDVFNNISDTYEECCERLLDNIEDPDDPDWGLSCLREILSALLGLAKKCDTASGWSERNRDRPSTESPRQKHLAFMEFDVAEWPVSPQELKKRYRDLARKCHPDIGGDKERMIHLKESFDWLKKDLDRNAA